MIDRRLGFLGFEDVDDNLRVVMKLDIEILRGPRGVYMDERGC